jgi:hypothetical protein
MKTNRTLIVLSISAALTTPLPCRRFAAGCDHTLVVPGERL